MDKSSLGVYFNKVHEYISIYLKYCFKPRTLLFRKKDLPMLSVNEFQCLSNIDRNGYIKLIEYNYFIGRFLFLYINGYGMKDWGK